MPNIADMRESKFLRKTDIEPATVLTIRDCVQMNVAMADSPKPENKWCLEFREDFKPFVLNMVNASTIAEITGSENTDDWHGHQIEIYFDENIFFGGKRTGGLRVRHPAQARPAAHHPAQRQPVPVSGPVSNKAILKQRLKAHPEFNKTLMPQAVNEYCINKWGFKVDDLPEDAAAEAIEGFALLVNDCLDDIPF